MFTARYDWVFKSNRYSLDLKELILTLEGDEWIASCPECLTPCANLPDIY